MKFMIVCMALILASGCESKHDLATTVIKANSMVCGSCAKNVQKAVARVEGVKEVNVDIKTKTVQVSFLPAKTDVGMIESAITGAGYDANERKRDKEAYEKLDACCKIDG